MRKLLIAIAVLVMAGISSATTTVAGNLANLGTGTSSGFVRFWLRGCGGNQPRVNSVAVIAPTQGGTYYFDIPAVAGVVNGTIYSTRAADGIAAGELSCGGSFNIWYGMQVSTNGKFGPEIPVAAKNGVTLDPSNVTPINVNPVVTAPTGDDTYLRLDAGNSPVTGRPQFNLGMDFPQITAPANPASGNCRLWFDSTTHKLSAIDSSGNPCFPLSSGGGGGSVPAGITSALVRYIDGPNGVVGTASGISDDGATVSTSENFVPAVLDGATYYASAQTGADNSAKIQAAITSCPGPSCVIDGRGLPSETSGGSTNIDPGSSKIVTILLPAGTTYVNQISLRNSLKIYGMGSGGFTQQSILQSCSTCGTNDVFVLGGTTAMGGVELRGFRIYGANGASGSSNQSAIAAIAQINGGGLWLSEIRDLNILGFCGSGGSHGIIRLDGTAGGSPPAINQFDTFVHIEAYRPSGCGPVVEMQGFSGQIRFLDSHLDSQSLVTTGTNVLIKDTSSSLFPFNIFFDNVTIQGGAVGVSAAGCNICTFNQMHHELEAGAYLVPAGSGANTNITISNSQFNGNVGQNSGNGYIVNVVAPATNASVFFSGNNFTNPDFVFLGNTAAVTSIGNTGGAPTISGTEWYASNTLIGGVYVPSPGIMRADGTFDASLATKFLPRKTTQANPNSPLINCVVGEVIFSTASTSGQNLWECTGTNTWTQQLNSGAGGMSTSAGNASGTAVPVDWSPSTAGSQNLGATAKPWGNLFLGNAATNNNKLTSTTTAARTTTFPDNTGTVAELNLAQTWTANQTFSKIVSASSNSSTTGCFLCFGTGDIARYWNPSLAQYLNLIGDGGSGPVPVGDSPGISVGTTITGQVAGTGITIQPLASTGNNNGADLSLISGNETGAGRHGDVIINAGIDGVVQALTGFGFPVVNNPTTIHPVINSLASYSSGQAIITPHASTSSLVGVCIRNCGTSGSGIFVRNGLADLILDNAGSAGDLVYISSTIDGAGTDVVVGSAPPTQYVGRVVANISGSLYQVDVCLGCESFSSAVAGAVALNPAVNQTIQGTGATVIGLTLKCPASAASTLACFQSTDNTGANVIKAQQNGQVQIGTGVTGTVQLTGVLGPNATPAAAGLIRNSDTDVALAWRNHANSGDIGLSKDVNDVVTLSGIFRSLQGQFTNGVIDLTEATAPSALASHDVCYADSSAHAIKCSLNNGSFISVPLIAGDLGGTAAAPIVSKVNGTSVPTNSAADQFLGTTASATGAWAAVPNCGDASHGLAYNTSTHAFSCQSITGSAGGVADPGGNGFMSRTALNTSINRTLTGTANQISITNGTGVSGDPVFSLDTTHVATDTNSLTFTNKTADAEGTGNVYTRPFYAEFSPGCNNGTGDKGSFDVPTSGAATFTCFGTTTTHAAADFVDASTTTVTGHFTLPQGWTGNMDARIYWFGGTSSSNAVRWSVATGCIADTEAVSTGPSYNTASASNTAYTGTANQRKTTTLSAIAMTNCSAGEEMYFQLQRIGADAGDTYAASAEALSIQFEGRFTK
jgi:hypothetical protein